MNEISELKVIAIIREKRKYQPFKVNGCTALCNDNEMRQGAYWFTFFHWIADVLILWFLQHSSSMYNSEKIYFDHSSAHEVSAEV